MTEYGRCCLAPWMYERYKEYILVALVAEILQDDILDIRDWLYDE